MQILVSLGGTRSDVIDTLRKRTHNVNITSKLEYKNNANSHFTR